MINYRTIARMLAFLSLIACIFMMPSFIASMLMDDGQVRIAFIKSIAITLVPAIFVINLLRRPENTKVSTRDGFLLAFFAWLSLSLCASLPYYFSGAIPQMADAFFEASSGISTTGATILADIEALPSSLLLWRSTTHWMGGMGVIMLTVALLPLLGIGGVQLVRAEQMGIDSTSKMTSRIGTTAKAVVIIYTCFTVIFTILLRIGGMSLFDAVNHAFSAIASGGFSSKNVSLAAYSSPYIQWVTIAAMFIAGISFALYYNLFTGKIKRVIKNTEIKAYIFIILTAGLTISLVNRYHGLFGSVEETIRASLFQVVSILTSTGFSTEDYNNWPFLCQFVLFTLLFVGGCSGSTSGGFKVVRAVILFKQALVELKRLIHPRGIFLLRLNGTTITKNVVFGVSGFFFLYVLSVVIVSAVAASANVDLTTSIATGLSIVGNTGIGFGDVGPLYNYGFYPSYVKWVLGFAMLMGRLELYAFFVLLTPAFWKR